MGHVGVFLSASLEDGTPGGSCLLHACNPVFLVVRVGIPEGRGPLSCWGSAVFGVAFPSTSWATNVGKLALVAEREGQECAQRSALLRFRQSWS